MQNTEWTRTQLTYSHLDQQLSFTLHSLIEPSNSFHPNLKYQFEANIPADLLKTCHTKYQGSNLIIHLNQKLVKDVFIDPYQFSNLLTFRKKQLESDGLTFFLHDTPIELELPVDRIDDQFTNVYDIYWNLEAKSHSQSETTKISTLSAQFEIPLFGRYQPPKTTVYNEIYLPKTSISLGCYSKSSTQTDTFEPHHILNHTIQDTLSTPIVIPSVNPELHPTFTYLTWIIVLSGFVYLIISLLKIDFDPIYNVLPNTDPNYTLVQLKDREIKKD